ncbi:hypothetical protein NDU88_006325 [Pleurodeles waltl]|uniref:Uncharacterized protein n=1 Tax=Pleurodeles waltl TaxID=8319 RepID=A0AAV7WA92_PLEWA|nr:hypothetical protein NDU88_006325 [Pleurodeles waltl]
MPTSSQPSCFSTGDGRVFLHLDVLDALISLEKAPAYAPVGAKHVLADHVVFPLDPFTDVTNFGNISVPAIHNK